MLRLKGTSASPGLAIGQVYWLRHEVPHAERAAAADVAAELRRLDAALVQAGAEIAAVRDHTAQAVGEAEAAIFDAHQMFLADPALVDATRERIREGGLTAEWTLQVVGNELADQLAGLADDYLRERAADVRDVVRRVVRILLGLPAPSLAELREPAVVVADDLTPSETAHLDHRLVLGFATDSGGPTSHTAIMARTLGIPAVVGLADVTARVRHGATVILDGSNGEVIADPDPAALAVARERAEQLRLRREQLQRLVSQPAVTADGVRVELAANIGKPSEAEAALDFGAEGVGLFRTEFLYMDRSGLPSEEEQFQAYKAVLVRMGPERPVIIRTLDIGGDKQLAALPLPVEANPFLGLRAVRLCLERPELFKTQLRALLRASVYGRLRIMYPMIQSLQEVVAANRLLDECRAELAAAAFPIGEPEVGIMVEIPAAAAIADLLAPHVDFFSIGTNDLIQYTLAVDRGNEHVAHLYQPFHPAVLRLIGQVCAASHAAGKWTGMCGEMAGLPTAAPVLLGLGLDEWSMSAPDLPAVKEIIRSVSRAEARTLAAELLRLPDATEIRQRAEAFYAAQTRR